MTKTESDTLEYVRKVFQALSTEKQDYVVNTARTLLEIQDDAVFPVVTDTSVAAAIEVIV